MNGHLIPGTPIAVDCWLRKHVSTARVFFLSHAHSDHTIGLTPAWPNLIYASPTTVDIVRHKLNVPSEVLRPLAVGQSHVVPYDETSSDTFTVTLIDADHCPGSVVFVFEGFFGTVVYTGDFRYYEALPGFVDRFCPSGIDLLYFDDTHFDKKYNIPSLQESIRQIIDVVERHAGVDVKIGLRSFCGQERLLRCVAAATQSKIIVDVKRYDMLRTFGMHDAFTTDVADSRIAVVPLKAVNAKNLAKWNARKRTIAIVLSATPQRSRSCNVFLVSYSDHASMAETKTLLTRLCPKRICRIVRRGVVEQHLDSEAFVLDTETVSKNNRTVALAKSRNVPFSRKRRRKACVRYVPMRRKIRRISYESDDDDDAMSENALSKAMMLYHHVVEFPYENIQTFTLSSIDSYGFGERFESLLRRTSFAMFLAPDDVSACSASALAPMAEYALARQKDIEPMFHVAWKSLPKFNTKEYSCYLYRTHGEQRSDYCFDLSFDKENVTVDFLRGSVDAPTERVCKPSQPDLTGVLPAKRRKTVVQNDFFQLTKTLENQIRQLVSMRKDICYVDPKPIESGSLTHQALLKLKHSFSSYNSVI